MKESDLLTEDAAYWIMTWGKQFPNKPAKEVMFEPEKAISTLLDEEVVFINNHWWEKDWPKEARESIGLYVNVNDAFAPAADAEELLYDQIQSLYDHWLRDNLYGPIVWCCGIRKMKPLDRVYNRILNRGSGVWTEKYIENIIHENIKKY